MWDMPSSGGAVSVKSEEMSPLLLVAVVEGVEPKSAIARWVGKACGKGV